MVLRVVLAAGLVVLVAAACGGGDGAEPAADAVRADTVVAAPLEADTPAETSAGAAEVRLDLPQGRAIGPGAAGEHVRALQEALALLGYDAGKPDGQYGPATRRAIVAFQRDHGLAADGLAGTKTIKAVNSALAGEPVG